MPIPIESFNHFNNISKNVSHDINTKSSRATSRGLANTDKKMLTPPIDHSTIHNIIHRETPCPK